MIKSQNSQNRTYQPLLKRVTIEYSEDITGGDANTPETTRGVRIVTTTERWCSSGRGDPITSSSYEVI
jgi:hypothetical protein